MGKKKTAFCKKIQDRLSAVDRRIQSLKTRLESLPSRTGQVIQTGFEKVLKQFQSGKERVKLIQTSLSSCIEQRKSQDVSSQLKRKTKKRVKRATRIEAFAVGAINKALATISDTEEAILKAVVARVEADTAVSEESAAI